METLVDLTDISVTDDDFIEIAEEMRATGTKFRVRRSEAGWFVRVANPEHEAPAREIDKQLGNWLDANGFDDQAFLCGSVTSM